ncbi:acyl carrier protein [Streptomyces mangrovisoli]|uniref:Carrier domain-containing protein n=1 Tax=Streptomyces mangrovisoli TaxID=1428628 RepID=A0A1J4NJU1_9ACTN|nr:acyl carrier protein [Streptomyces mangrovisoli]OIJ62567.1 hypothetical protein WN71_038835 [Streptomyces mangrovisoli]
MTATESATHGTGELTALVHRAWADALGHDEFTDEDNFFQVGGHSLGALQVVRDLGAALARRIPVRVLFRNPTVRYLAEALAAADTPEAARTADPARAARLPQAAEVRP